MEFKIKLKGYLLPRYVIKKLFQVMADDWHLFLSIIIETYRIW